MVFDQKTHADVSFSITYRTYSLLITLITQREKRRQKKCSFEAHYLSFCLSLAFENASYRVKSILYGVLVILSSSPKENFSPR